MRRERELAKVGIYPIGEIEYETKIKIARLATERLAGSFSCLSEQYNELWIRLGNCKMYYAKIDSNVGKVNYFYKDGAIYYSDTVNLEKMDATILHECIHFLQDSRNIDGSLNRLGLCRFSEFKVLGLGINEGAVQYIASKAMEEKIHRRIEKGLIYFTLNENYYPFLTSLFIQLTILMGEEKLVNSTINSKQEFEEDFFNLFEENASKILSKMDNLMDLEVQMDNEEKKIKLYFELQELILTTYFVKVAKYAEKIEEIERYKEQLEQLQQILGRNQEINYQDKGEELRDILNQRYIKLSRQTSKNSLLVLYQSKLMQFLKRILSYLGEK